MQYLWVYDAPVNPSINNSSRSGKIEKRKIFEWQTFQKYPINRLKKNLTERDNQMKVTLTKLEFLNLYFLGMYIEDKEKRFSVLKH